jgi:DNA invertase Pin-like site-specific DNA recombinase
MTIFAYTRISTVDQSTFSFETQLEEIQKKFPVDVVIRETASSQKERPLLTELLGDLQPNDLLIVAKLDRFARSTQEALSLIQTIHSKNAEFLSLDLPSSDDVAVNKMIFTILACLGEFEYNRRKDRVKEGIARARAANKYLGRKSVLTEQKQKEVIRLFTENKLNITQISKQMNISRTTLSNFFNKNKEVKYSFQKEKSEELESKP